VQSYNYADRLALLSVSKLMTSFIHQKSKDNTWFFPLGLIIVLSFILRIAFLGSSDLLVEEAYYWNYAKHLDFSYLDHPPMVALLIKISTSILGATEFGVRIASVCCWLVTAFYSFKLTELFSKGSGLYAIMLLAILPFYFLHSLIMTPDQPLTACWSAALYYLYRALVMDKSSSWYAGGCSIGLGLLSKYTIILLGPSILLFLAIVPTKRYWFKRKEPYIAALIAIALFTPVIYWNATHEWASFIFQSTRRITAEFEFSFHHFLALLLFFLMPSGIISLVSLFTGNKPINQTGRFTQVFTLTPLLIFAAFSLSHQIKFNWIGPGLLAMIPWIASRITHSSYKIWLMTACALLVGYAVALCSIISGYPKFAQERLLIKFLAWNQVTKEINTIAARVEKESGKKPVIVPLDVYNIQSELAFYQEKLFNNKNIQTIYPTIGRHIFGADSLMYKYWAENPTLSGKILILVSRELFEFNLPGIKEKATERIARHDFLAKNQGETTNTTRFYYQVVEAK